MLTIFRRHTRTCPHRDKGRAYRHCSCPIAAEGLLKDDYVRQSLSTRNWEIAQGKIREMEANTLHPKPEDTEPKQEPLTLEKAIRQFMDDRHRLCAATLSKYEVLLTKQLKPFATKSGVLLLSELTEDRIRAFRDTWKDGPLSAYKKNERLRTFFKFFAKHMENPVPRLSVQKGTVKIKTFTPDQWNQLLEACDRYDTRGKYGAENRTRVRAFVLVLRHTGLRIGDVVTLKQTSINANGEVFLRTAKNDEPVWLPLPPTVLEAVRSIPVNGDYFFWTGNGLVKSAVADWQRSLRKLCEHASVKVHAHMFRHTFASELSARGVPMPLIAQILGDSEHIVRKHYQHFSPLFQKGISEAVRLAW